MASYKTAKHHPLLALEQMLEAKTTLRTQKLTHRNIICVGTDILKDIEKFMNCDKDAAVKKAIEDTEAKLLKERQIIIDEIVAKLMNENTISLEKERKRTEAEIAAVKYRCEVAEKKRSRLAQQKFEKEKEEALRKAADEAIQMREEAVELAEKELRDKMLIEGEEKTREAVQKTTYEMKKVADARVKESVKNTKELCERTAAAHLVKVENNYKTEIAELTSRLEKLTCAFERQKTEKEEYENHFVELKEDYKRFQNYTQGFCSDYLMM